RHTRSKRDWSSDVCSSDLRQNSSPSTWPSRYSMYAAEGGTAIMDNSAHTAAMSSTASFFAKPISFPHTLLFMFFRLPLHGFFFRSEERRVGKEGRCPSWRC